MGGRNISQCGNEWVLIMKVSTGLESVNVFR
jgi:hypothetical protein